MPVSVGCFETRTPVCRRLPTDSISNLLHPFKTECHYCGFVPADPPAKGSRCPKCGGSSWDRVVVPGSLLTNAERVIDTAVPLMR